MVFLDLSAAFDTVNRDIFLERLSRTFGIQGTTLQWFQSYLNDRMEHVLYNGREVSSENSVVRCAAGGQYLALFYFCCIPQT